MGACGIERGQDGEPRSRYVCERGLYPSPHNSPKTGDRGCNPGGAVLSSRHDRDPGK